MRVRVSVFCAYDEVNTREDLHTSYGNTLKLEAFLSLTRIRISCALSLPLSLAFVQATMKFFLSRQGQ